MGFKIIVDRVPGWVSDLDWLQLELGKIFVGQLFSSLAKFCSSLANLTSQPESQAQNSEGNLPGTVVPWRHILIYDENDP